MKLLFVLLIIIPKLVYALPECPKDPDAPWDECIGQAVLEGVKNYNGEWRENKINGQGVMSIANYWEYKGFFKNDAFHGQGVMMWANQIYDGGWVNGAFHGQGTFTIYNVATYVGGWLNGQKVGQGTMFYPDSTKHSGIWKNGKLNGQVTVTCANKEILAGKYIFDKEKGSPSLTLPDGSTILLKKNGSC